MRRVETLFLAILLAGCEPAMTDWESLKKQIRSEFPDVEQVSAESLRSRLQTEERFKPVLLDARSEEEYRVSHLPGAIRVDPGGALPEFLQTLEPGTPLVAYCSVGYRSARLARRLQEEGFADVRNLEGSIFEWANKGYPLERDGVSVREVHPFDETWGRLLDPGLHAYRPGRP